VQIKDSSNPVIVKEKSQTRILQNNTANDIIKIMLSEDKEWQIQQDVIEAIDTGSLACVKRETEKIWRTILAIDKGMRNMNGESARQLCDDLDLSIMVKKAGTAERQLLDAILGEASEYETRKFTKLEIKSHLYEKINQTSCYYKKYVKQSLNDDELLGIAEKHEVNLPQVRKIARSTAKLQYTSGIDISENGFRRFLKAGINIPETSFLVGETMAKTRDMRLPLYTPIEDFPTHKAERDKIQEVLSKIDKILGRDYGEAKWSMVHNSSQFDHAFNEEELEFIKPKRLSNYCAIGKLGLGSWEFLLDMDNHGLLEARKTLQNLYNSGYMSILQRYSAWYPQLFENDKVHDALSGRVKTNFMTAMAQHNNHTHSNKRGGITLGYRSVLKDLVRLNGLPPQAERELRWGLPASNNNDEIALEKQTSIKELYSDPITEQESVPEIQVDDPYELPF
jgi:hypothetical protein